MTQGFQNNIQKTPINLIQKPIIKSRAPLLIGNGDLNLNTGINGDGSNLLHHIRGAEQVDNTLVDTKFKSVPRVGSYKFGNERVRIRKIK